MSSNVIYEQGEDTVVVAATESVAVATKGTALVYQVTGYPNLPDTKALIGTVTNTQTVFGAYASGTTLVIEAGAGDVLYQSGVAPVVIELYASQIQAAPVALNATGAVTAAAILGGILTSTTAAAVAGTVPTGTVMDAAAEMAINDSVDWAIINTGGNTFTVTGAAGHTLVGTATVITVVSGLFRTRKTAANTFVTYRLG
ncbi:MAG: hypothetical protein ABUJ92_00495 [Desulfobacterales bacterium]